MTEQSNLTVKYPLSVVDSEFAIAYSPLFYAIEMQFTQPYLG